MTTRVARSARVARASIVLAIAVVGVCGVARAAVDVACVSLIGDALTRIERAATEKGGSRDPDNAYARDNLAASAAMRALTAKWPDTTAAVVEVNGPGTEPFFETPLAGINDRNAAALYGQLATGVARQVDAKRVLVIAKLSFRHWSDPSYTLAGVGVFADAGSRDTKSGRDARTGRYVAPYVGAVVLLFGVDGRLLAAQPIALHATYAGEAGKPVPSTPWQILSGDELNRAIDQLIVEGVRTAVSRLAL